jgi:hypothetical protein
VSEPPSPSATSGVGSSTVSDFDLTPYAVSYDTDRSRCLVIKIALNFLI